MAPSKTRDFHCGLVNEPVRIRLCNKRTGGLFSKQALFVRCDQGECQHVDRNEPPCPLTLALFAEEIREREEVARVRREESDY